MNDNALTEGPAIGVNPYVMDITAPEIIYVAVNMSFGNVSLRFSETVNISTFDPKQFRLKI